MTPSMAFLVVDGVHSVFSSCLSYKFDDISLYSAVFIDICLYYKHTKKKLALLDQYLILVIQILIVVYTHAWTGIISIMLLCQL